MHESAYNKLFWGMMFIVFNINLGPVNIMPNFLGYILILSGLSKLTEQSFIFQKAKIPAVILVIITLGDTFNIGQGDSLINGFQTYNLWFMAKGEVEMLLNLYVIFTICSGIYLLAEERGFEELKDSAKVCFNFYLFMNIVVLFYTPFSLNISRNANPLMILVLIINLLGALFIAGLFRKAKNQLCENKGDDLSV